MKINRAKLALTALALTLGLALAQMASDHHHPALVDSYSGVSMAEWIAREEGLRLCPYLDVGGIPTIGVGHELSTVRNADLSQWSCIAKEEALSLLEWDLKHFRNAVEDVVEIELTAGQEIALVSLAYNIGTGAFSTSHLLRLINQGAAEHLVVLEWTDWCKAHVAGHLEVLEGLLNRRRREVALFYGEWRQQ